MKKTFLPSCSQCGLCCTLFYINLTEEEWKSGRYITQLQEFFVHEKFSFVKRYGGNILQQNKDGGCIYLKNNTCSIHTRRPTACKDFFCCSRAKKFQGMIQQINERRDRDTIQS